MRKITATVTVALFALVLASSASATDAKRLSVRGLRVYAHRVAHSRARAQLTTPLQEIMSIEGAETSTSDLLLAGTDNSASIYSFRAGGSLCVVLVEVHAIGRCVANLTAAGATTSYGASILDGRTYVWGLATNSTKSVAVTVDGERREGTVSNNVFLIPIEDGTKGTGVVRVVTYQTTGDTHEDTSPGIPAPPSLPTG